MRRNEPMWTAEYPAVGIVSGSVNNGVSRGRIRSAGQPITSCGSVFPTMTINCICTHKTKFVRRDSSVDSNSFAPLFSNIYLTLLTSTSFRYIQFNLIIDRCDKKKTFLLGNSTTNYFRRITWIGSVENILHLLSWSSRSGGRNGGKWRKIINSCIRYRASGSSHLAVALYREAIATVINDYNVNLPAFCSSRLVYLAIQISTFQAGRLKRWRISDSDKFHSNLIRLSASSN